MSLSPMLLSVVLDGRVDRARARQQAELCARLGFAGVWWRQPPHLGPSPTDMPSLVAGLRNTPGTLRVGVMADLSGVGAGELEALVLAGDVYIALLGSARELESCRLSLSPGARRRVIAVSTGQRRPGGAGSDETGGFTAGALLAARPGRELGRELAAVSAAAGRPVIAEVCVSVGRTGAEAAARADHEPLFARLGHPREQGLFGSLEECQHMAAQLAHVGANELACNLPLTADIADVLAQLRAVSPVAPWRQH